MKTILLAGLACAAALLLSGCAGFTIPGMSAGAGQANDAFKAFITDPNCAHHDEANLVTGAAGMPASFNAHVLRDCPARPPIVNTPSAPIAAAASPPA